MKLSEIQKFREWSKNIPVASRTGEWECDYSRWSEIYSQVKEFLKFKNYLLWSDHEISELLYIVGRDNELQYLAGLITEDPERLIWLLQQCLHTTESDTKWQLIVEAGKFKEWDQSLEDTVYHLYFDKSYYVQRRTLMELAKKKSKYTLELAQYSWETHDEYQRICVLQALHDINYRGIEDFLKVALKSDHKYLVLNAERISKERSHT